jgi:hypothetical protein
LVLHESLFNLGDAAPVRIRYRANLRDTAGNPAHAATFIRRREIILDPELKKKPRTHRRILLHEYFHFAWVRLGNPHREEWGALLKSEWQTRARGEAGWSAEWRKKKLSPSDIASRTRSWREYCCESFCDTGALVFTPNPDRSEVTLSPVRLRVRVIWFKQTFPAQTFAI